MSQEASREATEATVHATCVLVGEVGVLLVGAPGAGKSTLARELVDHGARLVADDRVRLRARHGRLVARAHSAIAGLIEVRGLGPMRAPLHAQAAVVRLLVALDPRAARMAEMPDEALLGVRLPRLALAQGPGRPSAVLWRAHAIRDMIEIPW